MPIKLPKGFARRKSSTNVLETIENPPAEGSFRVLDRSNVEARSADPAQRLKRKSFAGIRPSTSPFNRRRSSFEGELNNKCENYTMASCPRRTNTSESSNSSSGGASSEARRSYASTTASSVENHSQDSIERPMEASRYYRPNRSPDSQTHENYGATPRPPQPPKHAHNPKSSEASFSIKGRTFSFSPTASNNTTPRMNGSDLDASQYPRQRAMTESSYASTATPRLDLDGNVGLGLEGDDLGGGFNEIFTSQARAMMFDDTIPSPPPPVARMGSDSVLLSRSPKQLIRQQSFESGPERIDVGRGKRVQESLDSSRWSKNGSADKLMASPPSGPHVDYTVQQNISEGSPNHSPNTDVHDDVFLDSLRASQALALEYAPPPLPEQSVAHTLVDRTRQKTPQPTESPNKSRNHSRDVSPYPPRRATTPQDLFGSEDDDKTIPLHQSTPKAAVVNDKISGAPVSVQMPRQRTPVPDLKGKNKVMTPAEFEFYRKQQDMAEPDDDRSQASESSDNYEDDEDEHERSKQIIRQRRRQEAHLAVYRQQMRKVTGEQPSGLPGDSSRPGIGRSTQSTPNFMSGFSSSTPNLLLGRDSPTSPRLDNDKTGSDDDEDVPLGVLQAHGFPHKNRPPTRLSVASTGNIPRSGSGSAYPAPPNATRNEPNAGGGAAGGLPPFARHLPQDPYVGASLINSTNRESLPYNSLSSQPQHHSPLPPGGLVGVIAGEERAKALRRGSPNQQGNFAQMGNTMGLPQQYQPPTLQQQQAQMMGLQMDPQQNSTNEMMKEFMQMQMQWMQSMMQMQNMQQNPNMMPQMIPDMMQMQQQMQPSQPHSQSSLGRSGGLQSNRPTSVVSHVSNQNPLSYSQQQQRQRPFAGMARHGFGAATQNLNPGIMPQQAAHSSSPSVYGMPAGYTPSIAPSERSNVGQPSRYRPVTSHGMNGSQSGGGLNNESRTHTMTGGFPTGLSYQGGLHGGRSTPGPGGSYSQPQQSTIKAVSKPANNKAALPISDDEEDEEGWATMRRKRQERKARQKAGAITSDDGMSSAASHGDAGLEALYYDGGSFSPT